MLKIMLTTMIIFLISGGVASASDRDALLEANNTIGNYVYKMIGAIKHCNNTNTEAISSEFTETSKSWVKRNNAVLKKLDFKIFNYNMKNLGSKINQTDLTMKRIKVSEENYTKMKNNTSESEQCKKILTTMKNSKSDIKNKYPNEYSFINK